MRLATIDEMVPNEKRYYMKTYHPMVFHLVEFSSLCDWSMIEDMVKCKYVYVKED